MQSPTDAILPPILSDIDGERVIASQHIVRQVGNIVFLVNATSPLFLYVFLSFSLFSSRLRSSSANNILHVSVGVDNEALVAIVNAVFRRHVCCLLVLHSFLLSAALLAFPPFFKWLCAFNRLFFRIDISSLRLLPFTFIWTFDYCIDDCCCIGSFHYPFRHHRSRRISRKDDDMEYLLQPDKLYIGCDWRVPSSFPHFSFFHMNTYLDRLVTDSSPSLTTCMSSVLVEVCAKASTCLTSTPCPQCPLESWQCRKDKQGSRNYKMLLVAVRNAQ